MEYWLLANSDGLSDRDLNEWALQGWRVHTVLFNDFGDIVKALLQRDRE